MGKGRPRELTDDERRERNNAYHRAYYAAHRDQIAQRARERRAQNIDREREKRKTYYEANKERIKRQSAEYYAAHRAAQQEKQRQWREANREAKNRKARERYAANREKILAQRGDVKETRKRQTHDDKNRKRREYYAANRDYILAQRKKREIEKYMAAKAEGRKMDDGEHDTTAC